MKRIRLSNSALDLKQACDRLFQIERLLKGERNVYEAAQFSRGHAWGKGVQVYLLTGNMDLALYQAWLAYWPDIEQHSKITLRRTLHALMCAQKDLDAILERYEVVSFNGHPAVELGYKLNINEIFYYVGFIDLVLRNKESGLYVILEIKYTGSWLDVNAMFFNSPQGVGYSIALDKIVGEQLSEYGVLYFVCQDSQPKPEQIRFHTLEWEKSLKDRLKWFITLGMDVQSIQQMRELNVFPQRYKSCIRFNKNCQHFGTCGLTVGDTERDDEIDPHEAAGKYQFEYDLDTLIQEHLERTA